jgi:peptidoglycan/xylan/chitin deacetylase (PgdA/CDA1 family)
MNEEKNVGLVCGKLYELRQHYRGLLEALFVLNNCTDRTEEVLESIRRWPGYEFIKIYRLEQGNSRTRRKSTSQCDNMNVLSVDLESWVHRDRIDGDRKRVDDGYILRSTEKILHLLDEHNIKTTFFVVAEIYDWYPDLIDKIKAKGHEIAYHTHTHRTLKSKDILIDELERSSSFLDKFRPKGFRAPDIFTKKEYFEILSEWGFEYDSSIYGPFSLSTTINNILEIPVSSYRYGGKPTLSFPRNLSLNLLTREIPVGSGYFMELLGSRLSYFIKKINRSGMPFISFFHPWQIDAPPNKNQYFKDFPQKIFEPPYRFNCYEVIQHLLKNYRFRTFEEVQKEIQKRSNKPLCLEPGRGSAMRKGVELAQGNIVVLMDSDGQYNPANIPDIINPMVKYGYRVVTPADYESRGFLRRTYSKIFTKITKRFLGVEFVQPGFKAVEREVALRTMPKDVPHLDIDVRWMNNVINDAKKEGYEISDGKIPIPIYPRKYGKTTFKPLKLAFGLLYTTFGLYTKNRIGRELPFPEPLKRITLYPRK